MDKWFPIIIVCLLLAGCNGVTVTGTAEGSPDQVTIDSGYPNPNPIDSGPGYPVDDNFEEIFLANLTPNAPAPEVTNELGAVTVKLLYAGTDRPVRGQPFFAAGTLPVEGVEDAYIPRLDTSVDRSGFSDSQGLVVISLIPPGKYILVLLTPMGPILVEEEVTSNPIDIEITAGEIVDLGILSVLLDPGPIEP